MKQCISAEFLYRLRRYKCNEVMKNICKNKNLDKIFFTIIYNYHSFMLIFKNVEFWNQGFILNNFLLLNIKRTKLRLLNFICFAIHKEFCFSRISIFWNREVGVYRFFFPVHSYKNGKLDKYFLCSMRLGIIHFKRLSCSVSFLNLKILELSFLWQLLYFQEISYFMLYSFRFEYLFQLKHKSTRFYEQQFPIWTPKLPID